MPTHTTTAACRHATPRPLRPALRWWAVALVVALASTARALNPDCSVFQYNIRTWRQTNGLPSNAINAVVQASDGHLWLGTPKGLVDFDGVEFREVGLPGQPASRPRLISQLERADSGGLWLAIERGGFGRFDAGNFTALRQPRLGGEFPTTRVVHEAHDGSLFVALVGSLWRIPPAGTAERVGPSTDVLCVHEDNRGRIWFGTAYGELFYWENGAVKLVGGPAAALWKGFVISAIAVDRDGGVWVGASNGLHHLAPDLAPLPPTGIAGQPRALLFDRHGVLWIGTISGGLLRLKDGALTGLGLNDGLASNRILALAESDEGSLWIGTEDGLSQLSDVKFPIISVREGLSAEACLAVVPAPDGGVWAGTSNGLTCIVGERCTAFGYNRADGFPSEWVRRLFAARNGDLYFLGGRRDLSRFRDGRVTKTWFSDTWPQTLAEDATGLIVSQGNNLLRLENDSLVPYRLADGSTPALGWIDALRVARDGSLWIAAKPGLTQIRDGVAHDLLATRKLADPVFFFLCEDDRGAMWAARNSGLVRLRGDTFATVDHTQGLPSDLVYAIVPDLLGNFWCDSPEGIFRVSQRELNAVADGTVPRLNCTVFAGQHAVKTAEKSSRDYTGCRSADGLIWFPSAKGVIRIDPARVPMDVRPPVTYLKRILVDGREFPTDREPELQPGSGNLEFTYAALDYLAPERIRYRYRLDGFQDDWIEAGARRTAFFTNLPPGRYQFRIQACNADGVWSTVDTTFALTLPPRLAQTWWFRTAAGLLVAGLLGFAAWARERQRRRQLAEIRHREELQLQMLESSPVAMAMLDRHRAVVFTNATFTRIFGYSAAEVPDLDTLFLRICPPDTDRTDWTAAWRERFAAVTPGSPGGEAVEAAVVSKDGVLHIVAIALTAVGERTLLVCTDLTARRRAEEERRNLEERLRQGQKMEAIGRLSGGVAHDFNNMLTAILGNVSLVETDAQLPREVAGSIADIKEAATRAANLTRQLLAFSRKQPIHATTLDLNSIVGDMARMLERILGEDIKMAFELSAAPTPLHADAAMLEQVLLNLSVNARDAMPDGGRLLVATAIVEVSAAEVPAAPNARAGRFVRLTVGDTGNGIPPAILPRIFEPFFTTKDVGKGTGLGLATVYGIVEQHRGWIAVESEVGRGTTFHVYLPYLEIAAATAARATDAPTSRSRPARSFTILVVEDDSSVRALARRALGARGHEVLEAASGPEALQVWAEHRHRIEILLTDVVMPEGLNGLELARRVTAEKPELRVVYSSGYSADIAGGDFSGREGIDFLPKPYEPSALIRIIEQQATPR